MEKGQSWSKLVQGISPGVSNLFPCVIKLLFLYFFCSLNFETSPAEQKITTKQKDQVRSKSPWIVLTFMIVPNFKISIICCTAESGLEYFCQHLWQSTGQGVLLTTPNSFTLIKYLRTQKVQYSKTLNTHPV